MSFLGKLFGSNEREITKLKTTVEQINNLESDLEKLSDEELKAKTTEFKARIGEKMAQYRPAERLATETDDAAFEEEQKKRLAQYEQKILDELLPE